MLNYDRPELKIKAAAIRRESPTMFEFLKIVNFLSFLVAIGAGISNLALGARLASFSA